MTARYSKKSPSKKAKRPQRNWGLKDFVDSVYRVMLKQEKKSPAIKALHERLTNTEKKTKIIALTGNFGTGKSTVAKIFSEAGVVCLDADQVAHEVSLPHAPAWEAIVEHWGEEILKPDQSVDRKKLADIIFQQPEERKCLEAILHPRIREKLQEEIQRLSQQKEPLVVLEIPLLFEVGWNKEKMWDAIVVVSCSPEQQRLRIKEKLGLSETEIAAREQAQWPLEKKLALATHIIDNSGSPEETRKQVATLLKQFLNPKL